jgi:predicted short-subunit dehydrogenase-like oxidoreductase (DUF2520 family)
MRELERDLPTADDDAPAGGARALTGLTIVGAGRVGTALAAAAERAGLDVALVGRGELPASPDALLLCVPDTAIGQAAEAIAAGVDRTPRFAGHTSGATPLAALAPLAARGSSLFSMHPLQTVPDANSDLTGSPAAIAADDSRAAAFAAGLARRLGLAPFALPEDARAAYHAAATIASNFLVALEESAADLMGRLDLDDARELLAPLVLRTASNWAERGEAALTGPIARGDEETVARHLEALRDVAPDLAPMYQALAERTRAIAGRREGLAAGGDGGRR